MPVLASGMPSSRRSVFFLVCLLRLFAAIQPCLAQNLNLTTVTFSYVSLPSDSSFGYGWSACVLGTMLANMTGATAEGGITYSISNVTATRTWIAVDGSIHLRSLTLAQSTLLSSLLYQSPAHVLSFAQDVHFASSSAVLFADSASVQHSSSLTLTLDQTTGSMYETSDTGASAPSNRIVNLTLLSASAGSTTTQQAVSCLLPQNASFYYGVVGGPRVLNDVGKIELLLSVPRSRRGRSALL